MLLLLGALDCTFERRTDRPTDRPADSGQRAAALADSVRAVIDAFDAALLAGDSTAVLALLDSALVVYESGAVDSSRAAYASGHLQADMRFLRSGVTKNVLSSDIEVLGAAALALTRYRISGDSDGQPVRMEGTQTMLLVRTPSGWKIRHIHWSSRRLAPPS
ncbi:MAG: nuclear transport factor 2 family protein [Gemmatimonadetes bacterium]|nr:nuclear transport factor 2 family protein [Gemmatimonadota bacterium]